MKFKLAFFTCALLLNGFSFGQISFENLKIDTTITGFQLAVDIEGTTKIFSKNGPSDIEAVNPSNFSFTIAPYLSASLAQEQFDMLMKMFEEGGYKITDLTQQDATFNGHTSHYISYSLSDEKTSNKYFVFYAYVIVNDTALLFTCEDYEDGIYIEKFMKTFHSITF